MGLAGLLTALESLVFEMATWMVLVPKTLLAVIRRPQMLPGLAKVPEGPDAKPPDEYVSPILLWLIVGVVPGVPIVASEWGPQWIAHALLARLGSDASIVAAAALLLLAPLSFATAQALVNGRRLSRSVLRQPFAIQCGCCAPLFLGYFIGVAAQLQTVLSSYERTYAAVSYVAFAGSLAWFLWAEYVVLRLDTRGGVLRVVATMGLGVVLWAGLITVSRLILLLASVYYA